MYDTEELGPDFFQHISDLPDIEHFAPGALDGRNGGAGALGHIRHALAKHPIDADHHFIAGLDEVDDTGLHAGAAGAAHRKGKSVLGAEQTPEHVLRLVHNLQELRIEMAD